MLRTVRAHLGVAADAASWAKDVALEYRRILSTGVGERVERSGAMKKVVKHKGLSKEELDAEKQRLMEAEKRRMGEIPFGKMLRCRVCHFTDGAVAGSKDFVNAAFECARHLFEPKRKNGARKMRGAGAAVKGMLWSARDLRVGIE